MAVDTAQPPPPSGDECSGVTLTIDELADATTMSAADARRLLGVAARVVCDYAPAAPTPLLNEAVIRFAGYLHGSDYGGVRREQIGPKEVEYVANHAAAFRNSGAAALLTRYKVRRAGAVG